MTRQIPESPLWWWRAERARLDALAGLDAGDRLAAADALVRHCPRCGGWTIGLACGTCARRELRDAR